LKALKGMEVRGQASADPRRMAWEILWRTHRDDAYTDLLLDSRLGRGPLLPAEDRRLVRELVLGTLRWQQSLDLVLSRVCHRPLRRLHPKLLVLLRMGVYQLLFLDRIPDYAAVHEAVQLARSLGLPHAGGLVNAVLREVQRRGRELLSLERELSPEDRIAQETSHPRWMVERWLEQWGEEETRALCEANNQPPPLVLRCNSLKITPEQLVHLLEKEGVRTSMTSYSPDGLLVQELPRPIDTLQAFREGYFSVQDEAAQLISRWLQVEPGQRVLDACAAPGGKGTHIAQLMKDRGEILSVDIHPSRLQLVESEVRRLGIRCIRLKVEDLCRPVPLPLEPYDRIMLDAPCTGLGVIRRHPDIKWRRRPQDVKELAALQRALLESLAPRLRPGGVLLFAVCTHTPEETLGVVEAFLKENRQFRLLESAEGLPPAAQILVDSQGVFRTFPNRHGMDGFTAVRIQRC